jgi:hypothetical protein
MVLVPVGLLMIPAIMITITSLCMIGPMIGVHTLSTTMKLNHTLVHRLLPAHTTSRWNKSKQKEAKKRKNH